MSKETKYTNKDIFDFKKALLGNGYGSAEPFRTIFGLKRSTYYLMKSNPNKPLAAWHQSHLRVYKTLTYDALIKVIKDAHGIDVREVRN